MRKLKKTDLSTAKQWMQKHDVDPIDRLCREAVTEVRLTLDQAAHPSVAALVGSNWELLPDGNGFVLRLAVHRRIEVWKALAEFQYPKLRSTEIAVHEDRTITWMVQSFEKLPPPPAPSNRLKELPADTSEDNLNVT